MVQARSPITCQPHHFLLSQEAQCTNYLLSPSNSPSHFSLPHKHITVLSGDAHLSKQTNQQKHALKHPHNKPASGQDGAVSYALMRASSQNI